MSKRSLAGFGGFRRVGGRLRARTAPSAPAAAAPRLGFYRVAVRGGLLRLLRLLRRGGLGVAVLRGPRARAAAAAAAPARLPGVLVGIVRRRRAGARRRPALVRECLHGLGGLGGLLPLPAVGGALLGRRR